jgi:hypothetical protein
MSKVSAGILEAYKSTAMHDDGDETWTEVEGDVEGGK